MPNSLPLFSKAWGLDASTENKGLIRAAVHFLSPSWCRASGSTLESGTFKSNWFQKIVLCGDRAGRQVSRRMDRSTLAASWREHGKRNIFIFSNSVSAYSQWVGAHWNCSVWKVIKILWQKVKTGGKDRSPARTLYSAGKTACKSCNNWGILLSKLSCSVCLLWWAGKVILALKTLCFSSWALLPKEEGHFHTPDAASSGSQSWGQHGQGDCPSGDAVNAIYCWQAKKQFKTDLAAA